ncbi:hypothetical protein VT50_0210380 [Streptomyces antioxidans]|uniref:DUF624 domain-containing protein n=1 Tax=Streptomyces antioxidans TaxID=1507734 RepID=A0A1V4D7A4_9ACTN|nr:hypothetical protein [Streptomyces antioxidans]OPF80949.1 hypothetical protein VT50_0210380 [Streptomyces antioxidans]
MARTPTAPPRERREPGEVFGPGFSLFADMLLVSLLTSAACLPVVTAPAAFAAASATLRRAAGGTVQVRAGTYGTHLRAQLSARSVALGLVPPLLAVVVLIDAALMRAALPGAAVMAPALTLLVLGATVVALRATALPAPHLLSAREALLRSAADPRGSLLLAAAVVFGALLAWSIPLLVPLLPGPLAFAATVVDLRSPADVLER